MWTSARRYAALLKTSAGAGTARSLGGRVGHELALAVASDAAFEAGVLLALGLLGVLFGAARILAA